MQCHGITKKKERCKITVTPPGKYCKYHTFQDSDASVQGANAPTSSIPKPGYIYIFTLEHLTERHPQKLAWLSEVSSTNSQNPKVFNPKRKILIKIGYTTSTVKKRLSQWNTQCNQTFVPLNASKLESLLVSSRDKLVYHMNKLSLYPGADKLKNYDYTNLGFHCKNAPLAEAEIHKTLRKKYDEPTNGKMICGYCNKVHTEWFLVPRADLTVVFRLIDQLTE